MPLLYERIFRLGQLIQWKHLLLFVICLLAVQVFLRDGASSIGRPPAMAKSSPAVTDDGGLSFYNAEDVSVTPPVDVDKDSDQPTESGSLDDAVPTTEYVAACVAVKNQADDLVEFLVHHYHHMGIRRFYLMDDGSSPPLSTFEYPGIPRSALTFTFQSRETREFNMQVIFYNWCAERYRDKHTWIAFIDVDEFLETPGRESLSEVLKTFEGNETVGALGVNWRMHTSNGLLSRPQSTRKAFTECVFDGSEQAGQEDTDNRHVKPIVKTAYAKTTDNPHYFLTSPGTYTVGENGDVIEKAWRMPITRKRIGLHHYAVKSRAEYVEKQDRGNGMTDPKGERFWKHVEEEIEHVSCPEMARYNP